ncbi:Rossmann-like domain-containing protein [Actinoplanes aureus]|uniref:Putative heavy-metal chelation domain-containing protein n=1 Tax=Actinoplanes aureus TaxID=2792083 RepID=A0A931CKK8_9ACTN|nr:DUF364 domain-containing protein [Actinoplanes aureus]MBG0566650.1 hypothetical protein [Actinoplanes aureus]
MIISPGVCAGYTSVDELLTAIRGGRHGVDPETVQVSVGFTTRQGVRHAGRGRGYRNQVLSLRVGAAVGSCAVEPDQLDDESVFACVGRSVADLLGHPDPAVRIAAADAYLAEMRPHASTASDVVTIAAGSSLEKSVARASAVIDLLPVTAGQRVLVVGVVNSLLHQLRQRGVAYLPCDRAGGSTEWDEPCRPDAAGLLDDCDALLVSGMTVGNGTFDALLEHARRTGKPMVAFAQTGSALLPCFLGAGLSAVSAEPYPFFWLDGGPSTVYRYRAPAGVRC